MDDSAEMVQLITAILRLASWQGTGHRASGPRKRAPKRPAEALVTDLHIWKETRLRL